MKGEGGVVPTRTDADKDPLCFHNEEETRIYFIAPEQYPELELVNNRTFHGLIVIGLKNQCVLVIEAAMLNSITL